MGQPESKPEPRLLSKVGLGRRIKQHIHRKSAGKSEALQLVLVGPKSSGKSSAGNGILGRKAFKTETGTLTCQTDRCETGGRAVTVVDTPGFTGDEKSDLEVIRTIKKACEDLEPPVVFLLVVPLKWNLRKSEDGQHMLRHVLGKVSVEHLMVLVTHTDQEEQDGSEKERVLRRGGDLQLTVGQCGGRFHLFSIAKSDGTQVSELMSKLDRMMQEGSKSPELSTSSEEQTPESTETSDQPKTHQHHQLPEQVEKNAPPEPRSPDEHKTERAGGMHSIRKNIQQLEDQMRSRREEEETLMRSQTSEYKAQLQKLRERILTH